jgi:tetratricopeptide (TPR) repeat protein
MEQPQSGDPLGSTLDAALADFMERLDRGEAVDREQFLREYPGVADELRAYFRDCDAVLGRTGPVATVVTGAGSSADDSRPPVAAGPGRPFDYELQEEIAHGGMGVVYRARQLSLNRVVAVKLIRAGTLATPGERQRFRAEAEIAALLDHPNIVPIYEVGEHAGLPFLSMKLIEGGSLAGRVPELLGDTRASARLVVAIAAAVEHAHRHGVLHRDLKPANVLIDGRGHPYVTDFGLAKRFGGEGDLSLSGSIVGTPSYMAPEQAAGRASRLTVATDVYGLGAILYECLTGRPPFHGGNVLETLRQLQHQDPAPPSRLRPGVPRDLDVICLKCLEKDPARRYGSAAELAADLNRFLKHEPILARPLGVAELALRWVMRHPAATAIAAVALLAVAGVGVAAGVALSAREYARGRAADSLEAADKVYVAMKSGLDERPEIDDEQRGLIEWLSDKYEKFSREDGDTPAIRRGVARASFRLGEIERALKRTASAEAAYLRAIALQEALGDREGLAETLNWLGELYREQGHRLDDAERVYRRALAIQSELAAESPARADYRRLQARALFNLGIVQMDTGRREEARRDYDRAIELLRGAGADKHADPAYRHELARCRINRGLLLQENGRLDAAEPDFRQAINLLRQLTLQRRFIYRLELAVACNNLGNLLAETNRPAEARQAHEEALALTGQLVVFFPARPEYRRELGLTHNSLGAVVWSRESPAAAEAHWRQARDVFAGLVREFGDVAEYQAHLGQTTGNLGWLLSEQKKHAAARAEFERAVPCYRAALKANPAHPAYLRGLRQQYQALAETCLQMGDPKAAAAAAKDLASAGEPPDALACYFAGCFLARAAGIARDPAESRGHADEALRHLRRAVEHGFRDRARLEKDRPGIFPALEGREEFRRLAEHLRGSG